MTTISAFKSGGRATITLPETGPARLWFPDGGAMGVYQCAAVKNLVAKYDAGVLDTGGLLEALRAAGFEVGTGR